MLSYGVLCCFLFVLFCLMLSNNCWSHAFMFLLFYVVLCCLMLPYFALGCLMLSSVHEQLLATLVLFRRMLSFVVLCCLVLSYKAFCCLMLSCVAL